MSKQFRVVLVGCGAMAKVWLEYALARANSLGDLVLVALVDLNLASAEAMQQHYQLNCPRYDDLERAIRETQANLVFDVTVPAAHQQVVLTASALGCDVLGEKPLASSMAAARQMCSAVAQAQRSYAVMQNRRYNNQLLAFKQLIAEIGEINTINAQFFIGPHFGGFRDLMDSPLLLDMAIHTFDQARFIAAADAVSVYCHEYNPKGSWYRGNAAAHCIFELSNGAVFSSNASWCAEGLATSWEGEWRVVGTRGSAIWNGTDPPVAEVLQQPDQTGFYRQLVRREIVPTNHSEGHVACLDEMLAALKTATTAATDCHDNIKSLAMVFGALESAKQQRKVPIEL
jgi:predicted dehydrogenase